jgi:hypothetical protein
MLLEYVAHLAIVHTSIIHCPGSFVHAQVVVLDDRLRIIFCETSPVEHLKVWAGKLVLSLPGFVEILLPDLPVTPGTDCSPPLLLLFVSVQSHA